MAKLDVIVRELHDDMEVADKAGGLDTARHLHAPRPCASEEAPVPQRTAAKARRVGQLSTTRRAAVASSDCHGTF